MRGGRPNWHNSDSFNWSQLNGSNGKGHGGWKDASLDSGHGPGNGHGHAHGWHGGHDHGQTPTPDPVPPVSENPDPGTTPDPTVPPVAENPGTTPDPTVPPVAENPGTTPDPTVPPVAENPGTTPDPTVPPVAENPGTTPDPTVPPVACHPDPGTTPDPTVPPVAENPDPGTTPDPTVPPVAENPDPGTTPDPTVPPVAENPDPGTDPTTPTDPGSQPTPTPVNLTHSTTAIQTDHDGQVIEGLDLYVSSGSAITVSHDNVVIRNCRIHYEDGQGVFVDGAKNVTIENSEIVNSSPPSGIEGETSTELYNILAYQAPDLKVDNVTLKDGSSGIYLLESPNAQLSNLEGYNFHGPFPRGQFVQFDKSDGGSLSNFYVQNDPQHSLPEDIISVYQSPNVHVSQGLIEGNNSFSGVGVMFEGNSEGGKVDHVDVVGQGNGGFSSYAADVSFDYTRSFDNIATDQGRGPSESNALIWNVSNDGISIDNSTYTNPANPGNIVWDQSKAVVANVVEDPNATPMSHPVHNQFDWIA